MKYKISTFLLFFTFFSFAQTEAFTNDGKKVILNKNGTWKYAKISTIEKANNDILKKEALEFSTTVVSSFFARDCNVFLKALSNEVYTFKELHTITDELKKEICKDINKAIKDSSKTIDNYLNDYKIEILTKAELEIKMNSKTKWPEHYKVMEGDFFFLGFEKISKNSSTNYVWGDLFSFMVRKVDGKWQIKGLLEG